MRWRSWHPVCRPKGLSRDRQADATNGQVAVMSRPFVEVDDQNAFDESKFYRF
jgi:hypothetical protein